MNPKKIILKDHVTLKTEIIAKVSFDSTGKIIFSKSNISQYYCFYCIFDQLNASLMSIRDLF